MLSFNFEGTMPFLGKESLSNLIQANKGLLADIFSDKKCDTEQVFGWFNVDKWNTPQLFEQMKTKAREIREQADVFVLVGVGGSNNGARALIKAMESLKIEPGLEIVYAGNNLSGNAICKLLDQFEGKSVYMNVIAKNFETLEPGLSFRILRKWMREQYGERYSQRAIVTGTVGSQLNKLSDQNGFLFLPFPEDIGGRYSVLSPVGLFPIAVAGIEIEDVVGGARDMEKFLKETQFISNPAVIYAANRHLLEQRGFANEILSSFEPALEYFSKWWVQLFAESEGKNNTGIFPVACSFSEDLHSVGQYIQSGKRNMAELFLHVDEPEHNYTVQADEKIEDGFGYLNYMDVNSINDVAFWATVKAHEEGGVPCNIVSIPKLTPYYYGQLFYFFELTCYISGMFNHVNPFDQPGVEAYKSKMMHKLKGGIE